MRRGILALTVVLALMGASVLTPATPAAASHWALCSVNHGPLIPIPVALLPLFVAALPPGSAVACVNSNCFHPGALPYSPFRAHC